MLNYQIILSTQLFFICMCTLISNYNSYEEFLNKEITTKNFNNVSDFAESIGLGQFNILFNNFKIKYNKSYADNNEEEMRKFYFMQTLILIENNKQQLNKGEVRHKLAINKWADMSIEERHAIYSNWSKIQSTNFISKSSHKITDVNETQNLPQKFDWRDSKVVTDVKDQGRCGSCWAFAGIATIESAFAIQNKLKYPKLVAFSEQQVVDCANGKTYYSHGCEGGTVIDVYSYAIRNGIVIENEYPYMRNKSVCRKVTNLWKVKLSDFHSSIQVEDDDIKSTIYNYGPVAAVINAGDDNFQFYEKGIIIDKGNQTVYNGNTNHILTVVGWGVQENINYWILKNSYGKNWGENGYLRLIRGINSRGFNTLISYPVVKFQDTTIPTANNTESTITSNSELSTSSNNTESDSTNSAFLKLNAKNAITLKSIITLSIILNFIIIP